MKFTDWIGWIAIGTVGAISLASKLPSCPIDTFQSSGFSDRIHKVDGLRIDSRYAVYVPKSYNRNAKIPLVIFLHGDEAIGSDGRLPLKSGLAPEIYRMRLAGDDYPFLVLFPQSSTPWGNSVRDTRLVIDQLEVLCKEFSVDLDRIYLIAVGTGSVCLRELIDKYPDRWAALGIVSGEQVHRQVEQYRAVPTRIYQQAKERNNGVIEAVQELGGLKKIEVIEIDSQYADATSQAFSGVDLTNWIRAQIRN